MLDELKAVVCASCGARLKVKATAQRIKCAKCGNSFDVAAATAKATSVQPTNGQSKRFAMPPSSGRSVPSPNSESAAQLGFFSYVWRSYYHTHSSLPCLFAIILGVLLMPVLSFLKPRIGVEFMVGSCMVALAMSVLLFGVLLVIASSRYLFDKQRTIAEDQRSWLSAFVCFLGFLSPSLGIVATAELFAPAEGLFVKLIPQLKAEQTRLLGEVADAAAGPKDESEGNGSFSETADVKRIKSNPKDTDDDGGGEVAVFDDTKNKKSSSAKPNTDSVEETTEPAEEPAPKKSALSTKKRSSSNTATAGVDLKSKEVIAEGVGTTRSEAEKDAFRRAVREVVGAVVDSETLIKNDELIDDKVLIYSDGFIKKGWETISEKTKGGLVHLKIKVEVEQRSVVAKLKAANITMKQVDGKGLFAEAVTKIDAEKDAAALLKKQFAELPTLLTASIDGEPQFDKETSEVVAKVVVQADRPAYSAYVKRLEAVLDKVAVVKDSTLLKASERKATDGRAEYYNLDHLQLGGPPLTSNSQWCIWVNNFNNESHTTLKWNSYVVETDSIGIIRALEVPYGRSERPSDAKTSVTVSALDSKGGLINESEKELYCDPGKSKSFINLLLYNTGGLGESLPFLRHFMLRDLEGRKESDIDIDLSVAKTLQSLQPKSSEYRKNVSTNLYVSPYLLRTTFDGRGAMVGYCKELYVFARMKVTLEELKRIAKFQCEVSYKPATGQTTR